MGSVRGPDRPVHAVHLPAVALEAGLAAGHPEGGAHAAGLGTVEEMPARHRAIGNSDFHGTGNHDAWYRYADGKRRDGRTGCSHPGSHPQQGIHEERSSVPACRHAVPECRCCSGIAVPHQGSRYRQNRIAVCAGCAGGGVSGPRMGGDTRQQNTGTEGFDRPRLSVDDAADVDGRIHPDWLGLLFGSLSGCGWRLMGRTFVYLIARRLDRFSDRGQPFHILPGVLPGFLRDRFHHRAATCAGR